MSMTSWNYFGCLLANVSEKNLSNLPIKILVRGNSELLQQNYQYDEVVELLSDNEDLRYDVKRLLICMQELLAKQHSQENVIKIILAKSNAEAYARKLWTKITLCYLVLKVIVIATIIAIILGLLASYLRAFITGSSSGFIPGKPKPKLQFEKESLQFEMRFFSEQQTNGAPGNQNPILQIQEIVEQAFANNIIRVSTVDRGLYERIIRQFKDVRILGLDPAEMQPEPDFISSDEGEMSEKTLTERLEQQIVEAVKIGILPTE